MLNVSPELNIEQLPNQEKVNNLKSLNRFLETNKLPKLIEGRFEKAAIRSRELNKSEIKLSRKVDDLRRKMLRLSKLQDANFNLHSSLLEQSERTRSVGWFSKKLKESGDHCPFCNSETDSKIYLEELKYHGNELRELSSRSSSGTKVYQKELNDLKKDLKKAELELNRVREQINEFYNENDEQKEFSVTLTNAYEVIGRINELISVFERISDQNLIDKEIEEIESRIETLEGKTNKNALKRAKDKAIGEISKSIKTYASGYFNAERSNDNILLDTDNLTISFKNKHDDKNFLWEIGSGHNFLAYHISTILSIHQYLFDKPESKIPQMIIFDQPSQVYFPEDISDNDATKSQDDIERVRSIFKALAYFFRQVNKKVQIIVLEHVGEIGWTEIRDIQLKYRWRIEEEDNALIPDSWINPN